MKLPVLALFAGALVVGAGSASAQSIGIYGDSGSASCNIQAPLYTPTDFYIDAIYTGGLRAAEFQVLHTLNIGVDILVTPTANPAANVNLGNPMTGGCNIAFPDCQVGVSINLYTVSVTSINAANNNEKILSVAAHTTPSNVNFQCSLINLCDDPVFTSLCIAGGQAWMNGPYDCEPAVEGMTWGEVKNLFN